MSKITNFNDLGLSEDVLAALEKKGFKTPTEIQAAVIPALLGKSQDLIAQAQTGTGKTAAFGLPIIDNLPEKNDAIKAIVLTPTRELAIQVAEEMKSFIGKKRLKIALVYGGQSIVAQKKELKNGVDIVIGTPGRVMDHLRNRNMNLRELEYFVLDEADEMLKFGFYEDIEEILSSVNDRRQMLFFSATMPGPIKTLAEKFMNAPKTIRATTQEMTTSLTKQEYLIIKEAQKFDALCRIIESDLDFYGLVFCKTKRRVDEVVEELRARGQAVEGLHGDFTQKNRELILKKFRQGQCRSLIVTDVASRGLDITDLTHVINFALPHDAETYTHRIGRTGRGGKTGTAITLVTPAENRKLLQFQKRLNAEITPHKLPSPEEIEVKKLAGIKEKITNQLSEKINAKFTKLAEDLPLTTETLAAVLQIAFKSELAGKTYNKIANPQEDRGDRRGRSFKKRDWSDKPNWKSKSKFQRGPKKFKR